MRLKSQIFALSCLLAALSAMPAVANQSMPPTIAQRLCRVRIRILIKETTRNASIFIVRNIRTRFMAHAWICNRLAPITRRCRPAFAKTFTARRFSVQLNGSTCVIIRRVDATVQNPPPAEKNHVDYANCAMCGQIRAVHGIGEVAS